MRFFLFNGKSFEPNFTKLSECMIKFIEIIILNFKINSFNIQRDIFLVNLFYFHASMIVNKIHLEFHKLRQCTQKYQSNTLKF